MIIYGRYHAGKGSFRTFFLALAFWALIWSAIFAVVVVAPWVAPMMPTSLPFSGAYRLVIIALFCASASAAMAFSMVQLANNSIPAGGYLLDATPTFLLDDSGGKLLAR